MISFRRYSKNILRMKVLITTITVNSKSSQSLRWEHPQTWSALNPKNSSPPTEEKTSKPTKTTKRNCCLRCSPPPCPSNPLSTSSPRNLKLRIYSYCSSSNNSINSRYLHLYLHLNSRGWWILAIDLLSVLHLWCKQCSNLIHSSKCFKSN